MKTNEYSRINTMDQLRATRKILEAEVAADEAEMLSRCKAVQSMFCPRAILLPIIRKLREFLVDR